MFITMGVKEIVSQVILSIGEVLHDFISWIISFLPDDPFKLDEVLSVPQSVQNVLGFVNWLIPLGRCLQFVVIWISLILLVYFVKVLLTFFKFIS